MIDPIKSFDVIVENYKRYIKTAFRTRFDTLESEREALLNQEGTLFRQPWIEPLPEYKSSEKNISEITETDLGFNTEELGYFKKLVRCGLLKEEYKLHFHQYEMLRKSILENKNCVITSGTGSGKTEAFLLPLFASLSKEAIKKGWDKENLDGKSKEHKWWRKNGLNFREILDFNKGTFSNRVLQRGHETRKAAIRALVLYPMNALVEDQMTRLRVALDSDEARKFFDKEDWEDITAKKWNHNRIYFGRYNGSTPISGIIPILEETETRDEIKIKEEKGQRLVTRLREEIRNIEENSDKIHDYIRQFPNKTDNKYFFPNLDGAEMYTRFDMQQTPPDIFITNFSMLSIMLMRETDSLIFENTKNWLDEIDPQTNRRENIFHIIVDELHLYRGTQGTEVAFLIRMLLKRLGLEPNSRQVRFLASTASLDPLDAKSLKFLSDFFGVEFLPDQIIEGKVDFVNDEVEIEINIDLFRNICIAFDKANGDIFNKEFENSISKFIGESNQSKLELSVIEKLIKWGIRKKFNSIYGSKPRAIEIWNPLDNSETLAGKLFNSDMQPDILKEAVRGLLILRGLKDLWDESNDLIKNIKLPRFRFHYFIRNIEGLWANADLNTVNVNFRDNNFTPEILKRTIGKLSSKSGIVDGENRLFDVLYCENCGTTFLGGNRLFSNNHLEMIAVSPDIEGIPEKSTQSIIEKRRYSDYLIFWPKGAQTIADSDDFSYNRKGHNGTWVVYYLNRKSGSLEPQIDRISEDWINGRLFLLDNNFSGIDIKEPALSCTCPACGSNYKNGRTRLSPIRGFRSGFSKTAQILAKELFYQLPDIEDRRKLVLFSDSREDAAQVSNGIERSHFPDLVREAVIQTLYNSPKLNSNLIANEIENIWIKTNKLTANDISELRNKYPQNLDSIRQLYQWKRDSYDDGLLLIERKEASEAFYRIMNSPPSILFEDLANDSKQSVLQVLFYAGVNPQGCDREKQSINGSNGEKYNWWDDKIFEIDESTKEIVFSNNTFAVEELKSGVRDEAAKVLFGRLYFGLESSGLAIIGIRPEIYAIAIERKLNIEKIHSYIRVLGDNYYYEGSEYDPRGPLGNWNRRVINFIRANNDNPNDIYNLLRTLNFRDGNGITYALIDDEGRLQLKCLSLFIPVGDSYYRCSNCFRPHLHHSNGICTFCNGSIDISQISLSSLYESNFLAYHALLNRRKPLRLHCEEMTGQTDDQFERQRHFRNMVLRDERSDYDEGPERVRKIDILCVTTTLEVGVDIGSLQAVMLGNMPPQRFNYQQRVGRAGRRGQAYSIVLTFCRGRSHDEHYFNNPKEITGDPPPTPVLSIDQPRIFKRIFNKFILSEAYRGSGFARNGLSNSTHGELGELEKWVQNKSILLTWIGENRINLENYFKEISIGTDLNWNTINENDYYTGQGLVESIDYIISNKNIPGEEVADKLAEGGILPMFGMPTTVKNLYQGYDTKKNDMVTIDRDQSLAITEFAPGSEKTKDKAIFTAVGITPELKYMVSPPVHYPGKIKDDLPAFLFTGYMTKCNNCSRLETQQSDIDLVEDNVLYPPSIIICEFCGMPAKRFPIVIPSAYRTNFDKGKDNKEGSEIYLSRPPIYVVPNQNYIPEKVNIGNLLKSLSPLDTTWRVNSKGNDYFKLERKSVIKNYFKNNVNYRFELSDQWVVPESYIQFGATQTVSTGKLLTTALAANKTTEVFRFQPNAIPPGFYTSMFDNELQSSAIKAAVYSAAFLVQRAVAVDLDVDPMEIEIADIGKGENKLPIITLTDELPNGSGLVRHAFNEFEDLVCGRILQDNRPNNDFFLNIRSLSHKISCKDACYKCLKVYRNMNYHGLLDWRLGFSWLNFIMNPNYRCGVDGKFEEYSELENWPSIAEQVAISIGETFGGGQIVNFEDKLFGLNCSGHPIIIKHPLWNLDDIREEWLASAVIKLEERIREKGAKRVLKTVDTFNGLRRPAKCKDW